MDYATSQAQMLRQRRLADLLRAQVEATPSYTEPKSSMVSGYYVAPAWSQNLAAVAGPIAQRQRAAREEQLANDQEEQLGRMIAEARQKWQQQAPAITPGMPEQAGPVDPNNPTELAATPSRLPTRGQVLQHTLAGMDIPGNEKAAVLWNQGMGSELEREDKQTEFAALQKERLREARDLRIAALMQQAELQAERLAQQERQNVRDNETRLAHNQTMAELRRLQIEAMRDRAAATKGPSAADARAAAVDERDKQKDIQTLSKRMERITPVLGTAQEVQNLIDQYTDPKTGKVKSIPGIGYIGALPGWARSAGQEAGLISGKTNANRAVVQRLINNIVRVQAGLSQTISEQAKQIEANLSSGSYSQEDFVKAFNQLILDLEYDLGNIKAGHRPEAVEDYLTRGGRMELPKSGVAPSRSVEVTPEDAKRARLEELRAKAAGAK